MEKAPQIIFENVDFSYKNDENVLKDLNFTIKSRFTSGIDWCKWSG